MQHLYFYYFINRANCRGRERRTLAITF